MDEAHTSFMPIRAVARASGADNTGKADGKHTDCMRVKERTRLHGMTSYCSLSPWGALEGSDDGLGLGQDGRGGRAQETYMIAVVDGGKERARGWTNAQVGLCSRYGAR